MKSLNKFLTLCKATDLLIKTYRDHRFIKIIPTLHVLREHPEELKKYKLIIDNQIFKISWLVIKSFLYYFFHELKKIFKKGELIHGFKKLKYKNYSNIFISHFINSKQFALKEDFYFHNMPNISADKVKTLIVLINHSQLDLSRLINKISDKKFEVIVLSSNLDFINKVFLIMNTLKIFIIILRDILFKLKGLERIIMIKALADIFSIHSQFTFRLYYQINNIVRTLNPINLFFTYEGYAWERAICMASRRQSSLTKCIGYQHSRLFKYQHSIKRELSHEMDPDIILSSGKFPLEELQKKLKKIKIINIGKFISKKINVKKIEDFNNKKPIKICVLPEAYVDECYKLLSFSLISAQKNKNIFFIWRFHPLTDQKNVFSKLKLNNNLPKNIVISKNSLEEDLIKSHMVLYRGSTAALIAMRMGIFPIYYNIKNEFDIDFLDKEYKWSIKTHSPNDMSKKIKQLIKSKKDLLKLQNDLIFYSNNYFSNFDEKKFKNYFC